MDLHRGVSKSKGFRAVKLFRCPGFKGACMPVAATNPSPLRTRWPRGCKVILPRDRTSRKQHLRDRTSRKQHLRARHFATLVRRLHTQACFWRILFISATFRRESPFPTFFNPSIERGKYISTITQLSEPLFIVPFHVIRSDMTHVCH